MEQSFNRQQHWDNIYNTKSLNEVSWYQPMPLTSLEFIEELSILKTAPIIDVGGGDSFLVDNLLQLGFSDITVLDISQKAIQRAKGRLGADAEKINWIVGDIAQFIPQRQYAFWHDRAVFHFLTSNEDVEKYKLASVNGLQPKGKMLIGTFSSNGPTKCSGIDIQQYSEHSLAHCFEKDFEPITCKMTLHPTPFDTQQEFVFCSFTKR